MAFLDGHWKFKNITVYGRNAMMWGVTIHTKKYGYICFRLPLPCHGWHPLYLYFSPNATPWASTFHIGGPKRWKKKRRRAAISRKNLLGHNFDADDETCKTLLRRINNHYDV